MKLDPIEKTVTIKVLMCGPKSSGKKEWLEALYELIDAFFIDYKISPIGGSPDELIYVDYGEIVYKGLTCLLKVELMTATNETFNIITRSKVLQGIDGLIFIIDSRKIKWEDDIKCWNIIQEYFKDLLLTLPKVICFNKQDLDNKFNSADFLKAINYHEFENIDWLYLIAINNEGVIESFDKLVKLIIK